MSDIYPAILKNQHCHAQRMFWTQYDQQLSHCQDETNADQKVSGSKEEESSETVSDYYETDADQDLSGSKDVEESSETGYDYAVWSNFTLKVKSSEYDFLWSIVERDIDF